jgi:hypothetical protein
MGEPEMFPAEYEVYAETPSRSMYEKCALSLELVTYLESIH